MAHILYLTYDGLLDPLGQSQICPYIRGLTQRGHTFTVISFEKNDQFHDACTMPKERVDELLGMNTTWVPLRYRKSPRTLGTALNIVSAMTKALTIRSKVDLVHLRSYVLGPVALMMRLLRKSRFLFDIRGFWVQERVDTGSLHGSSAITGALRRLEGVLFRTADWIVTLTSRSVEHIETLSGNTNALNISVIPTAVDLWAFAPTSRPRSQRPFTFGYSGSLGSWYDHERLKTFSECMTRQGHKVRIATNTRDPELLNSLLMPNVEILHLDHSQVPAFINSCDAMFFFVVPHPSLVAMCPTKMGEALATGRPIITGPGIGDVDDLLEESDTGLILDESVMTSYDDASRRIEVFLQDSNLSERCIDTARRSFSLTAACAEYDRIYGILKGSEPQ